ncbi:hypothetical protein [uncultured Megasphaera sp.]|uniref:hypothetical protein n=1 Tax=uncultured Megasphaera sp. TaxID=165188 RepID=UPI0025987A7C|nr:hypothetical protein [uncultured Megasphaera sp.]
MELNYMKGTYVDELLWNGHPVLFVLEGLGKEEKIKAQQYGEMIWHWIVTHSHEFAKKASHIAAFKNKKWRAEEEGEVSSADVMRCFESITSVHSTYEKGFDVFFDGRSLFRERSIVIHVGRNYVLEGVQLL